MDSPLGPVLGNHFMGFNKKHSFRQFNFCNILLHRRYVDDIIGLFNCEADAINFFHYLKSRHRNRKCTFEKQNDGKLAFFDILLSNENDIFLTSVIRKKTSIGFYTNSISFTSFSYKNGLIKTWLYRAYKICSTWKLLDQETQIY